MIVWGRIDDEVLVDIELSNRTFVLYYKGREDIRSLMERRGLWEKEKLWLWELIIIQHVR